MYRAARTRCPLRRTMASVDRSEATSRHSTLVRGSTYTEFVLSDVRLANACSCGAAAVDCGRQRAHHAVPLRDGPTAPRRVLAVGCGCGQPGKPRSPAEPAHRHALWLLIPGVSAEPEG